MHRARAARPVVGRITPDFEVAGRSGGPTLAPLFPRAGHHGAVTLWIGTSGWQYRHWRDRLYRGVPSARWFDRYAETFATVELNVTFYRQPRPATFEAWARRAPDGFLFAVKASRFLTHVRRLREPVDAVERLMEGAERLGAHLGPILIQLPPDMKAEPGRLAETLDAFPSHVRVAVEPRHRSWFSEDVLGVLGARGAALCLADRRGAAQGSVARTADWAYVRFHGGRARPASCYGERALSTWVDRLGGLWPAATDVFAYFNNDHAGCAPRDAVVFAGLAAASGWQPTRVPALGEVPVG